MKNVKRNFVGKWITKKELSNYNPINVFHRQLDITNVEGKLDKNLHVLFRKKFNIENVDKTIIFISADDYYKLYINGNFVTLGPAPGFIFIITIMR